MIICYRCAKAIKGRAIRTNPPIIAIKLAGDFPKSFHPKCYDAAECEAAKELGKDYP